MMEIAKLALQSAAVFLSVIGLVWTILRAWRKEQAVRLQKELASINDAVNKGFEELRRAVKDDIEAVTCGLVEERRQRSENINRLHVRIDEMQADMIIDLQGRMSGMEGELKGVINILGQIQAWFINRGEKS